MWLNNRKVHYADVDRPPEQHLLGPGRSHEARDRGPASVRRGVRGGAVTALPDVEAGHLQAPEGAGPAGLIAKSREAQWRLCRLEAAPLREVADWMEPYRRYWDESFGRLDGHLRQMKQEQAKEKKDV